MTTSSQQQDNFVILRDPPCRFNTVSLDYDGLCELPVENRWLVLYLFDSALYLVERQECIETCRRVDNALLLDLKSVIQLPLSSSGVATADVDDESLLLQTSQIREQSDVVIDTINERQPRSYAHYYDKHRYDELLMKKTAIKYKTRVVAPYSLFSMATFMAQEGDTCGDDDDDYLHDNMTDYLSYLCDYALIQTQFKNTEHRFLMENKLMAYYKPRGGTGHPHMRMVTCMLNVIHCECNTAAVIQRGGGVTTFQKSDVRYVETSQLQCKMLQECVAWELFKLSRNDHCIAVDEFQRLVDSHVAYVGDLCAVAATTIPLPRWFNYRIAGGGATTFWVTQQVAPKDSCEQDSDLLYSVAFEWIPLMNLTTTTTSSIRIHHGLVTLSYKIFRDVFLPCLYRQILLDSFRLAHMCHMRLPPSHPIRRSLFKSQRLYAWFHDDVYQHIPSPAPNDPAIVHLLSSSSVIRGSGSTTTTTTHTNELYEYSTTRMNPDSPVVRKLLRRDNYMQIDDDAADPNKSSRRSQQQHQQQQYRPISDLVDIEDLNAHLPGCLRPVIAPGVYLKYMDRFTVVNYLIDMDYQLEQIIVFLRQNKREEIVAIYRQQIIKKRAMPGRMLSLTCGGQMGLDASYGNTTRCPYEARCHGDRRKKSDEYGPVEEKIRVQNEFKHACSVSAFGLVNPPRLSHPIDFVRHKLASLQIK